MPFPTRRLLEVEKKPTIMSSPFRNSFTAIIDSTYIIDFDNPSVQSATELSPNQEAGSVEKDTTPTFSPHKCDSHHGPVIDNSSIIDFDLLPELEPDALGFASEPRNITDDEYQEEDYQFCRKYLRNALEHLIHEDPESCKHQCIKFINAKFVPNVLKVEALQLLATIVPLPKALQYLGTATNIIIPYKKAEPQNLMWKGLFMTTRELLLRINNIGNEKVGYDDTTVYPSATAQESDVKKSEPGRKQVRFSEETIKAIESKKMRPYKTRHSASTLKKTLRIRGAWEKMYTVREGFKPKYACQPFL